jgi:ADP-ribose pyrophosphatase
MSRDDTAQTVWEGEYIKVIKQGRWEYVSRTRNVTAAVILAIHEGHVILVEQYRVPVGARCVELPAGLVGDETEGEEVAAAAIRELEEETGYRAGHMVDLGRFHSSAGMSSEGFNLLRAEDLTKVGEGGGVPGEDIEVHRVALDQVPAFLKAKRAQGCCADVKLLLLLASDFL